METKSPEESAGHSLLFAVKHIQSHAPHPHTCSNTSPWFNIFSVSPVNNILCQITEGKINRGCEQHGGKYRRCMALGREGGRKEKKESQ